MKQFYEDPVLELILYYGDVITESEPDPEPEEGVSGGGTP